MTNIIMKLHLLATAPLAVAPGVVFADMVSVFLPRARVRVRVACGRIALSISTSSSHSTHFVIVNVIGSNFVSAPLPC